MTTDIFKAALERDITTTVRLLDAVKPKAVEDFRLFSLCVPSYIAVAEVLARNSVRVERSDDGQRYLFLIHRADALTLCKTMETERPLTPAFLDAVGSAAPPGFLRAVTFSGTMAGTTQAPLAKLLSAAATTALARAGSRLAC